MIAGLVTVALLPKGQVGYNILLFGGFGVFLFCLFFCFEDLRERFLLLTFDFVVFVFLICRPILNCFMLRNWSRHFDPDAACFAVLCVAVSLLTLTAGARLAEKKLFRQKEEIARTPVMLKAPKKQVLEDFRLAALLLYGFTMVFFLIGEMDKLTFMIGREYNDYYTLYQADYPAVISTLAAMMPYALCAYLATMPRKRESFIALMLYVLSAVPQFLFGVRNPIVLHALLALLYYCIRDHLEDGEIWMGKLEKRATLIVLPVGAVGLSVLNYIRDGEEIKLSGFFSAVTDLFYKQGVSFNTLARGYMELDDLPGGDRNFTFGPFIDYFTQSRIGQMLFGTTEFPAGNCVERATYSHNLGHALSYVALDDYLEGHGMGSSYILEAYADFGWIGILVISLLLGILLIAFVRGFRKGWFARTVILVCLTELFFIPRAEATGWLLYLVQPHFWCIVAGCFIGGWILGKLRFRERAAALFGRKKQ